MHLRVIFLLFALAWLAGPRAHAEVSRESFYSREISNEAFKKDLKREAKAQQVSPETLLRALPRTTASSMFRRKGFPTSITYSPRIYSFQHGLTYFLPRSLPRTGSGARCLVFLHGGGDETNTYETAQAVAENYLMDFVPLAEAFRTILVFPSSSIGWSTHAPLLLRDLLEDMRRELPCDQDRIYLGGHSMGGMGIVREATYMTDLFAGIYSAASGPRDENISETLLLPYFNTSFYQFNGMRDEFTTFLPAVLKVDALMKRLSGKYEMPNPYHLLVTPADHSQTHDVMRKIFAWHLEKDIAPVRNLYSSKVFAYFWFYPGYDFPGLSIPPIPANHAGGRMKWLEALEMKEGGDGSGRSAARAEMHGNRIEITVPEDGLVTKFRVYLSKKLVNFRKLIVIRVNGQVAYTGFAKPSIETMVRIAREKEDHSFLFDAEVDVPVPERK